MIASWPFGTTFQVTGSAAIQYRCTEARAGAADTTARAVPAAATRTARRITASANLQHTLHPGVDAAHEVQRRALLGADVHRLARLRAQDEGVANLVDARRANVHDGFRRVPLLVDLMAERDLSADRVRRAAVVDLPARLRQVLPGDDREGLRRLRVLAL